MTHIAGFDRSQLLLLPEAIDDYVGLDNSVRFIDAFGFLSAYILVSLAAPAYLRKLKQLDKSALLVSVLAVSFMILPFLGVVGVPGSELFPPPKFPNNLLVWVFVAYMAGGAAWLVVLKIVNPRKFPALSKANEDRRVLGVVGADRTPAFANDVRGD